MKRPRKLSALLLTLALSAALAAGCGKKEATCPFTTITWGNTLEDIQKLEGDGSETYDSTVYGGPVYSYPKEYEGLEGTVKYSFDEENRLVSMAWMYEAKDSDDLAGVYDQIHSQAEDMLGKSGFKYNSDRFADLTSPGDVWYLDTGNVILNTVDAKDVKILQYNFLHPDVSEGSPQDSKK